MEHSAMATLWQSHPARQLTDVEAPPPEQAVLSGAKPSTAKTPALHTADSSPTVLPGVANDSSDDDIAIVRGRQSTDDGALGPSTKPRSTSSIDRRDYQKEDSEPSPTRPKTAPEAVVRTPRRVKSTGRQKSSARPGSRRSSRRRDRRHSQEGGPAALVDGNGVESNGVSWQFLRRFTAAKVSSELKQQATKIAIRRLKEQIVLTQQDLEAVWKKRRKQTATGVAAERPEMLRPAAKGAAQYQAAGITAIGLRLGTYHQFGAQLRVGQGWTNDGTGCRGSILGDSSLSATVYDDILRRVEVLDKEEDGFAQQEEQMGDWSASDFPRWRSDRGTGAMLGYHAQSQRWVLTKQYTSLWSEITVFAKSGMLYTGKRVWRQQGANITVDLQLLSGPEEEQAYVQDVYEGYMYQQQLMNKWDTSTAGEDKLATAAAESGLPASARPQSSDVTKSESCLEDWSTRMTTEQQHAPSQGQQKHPPQKRTGRHLDDSTRTADVRRKHTGDGDEAAVGSGTAASLDRLRQAVQTVQSAEQGRSHNRSGDSESSPRFRLESVVNAEMAENPYVPRQMTEELLLRRLHFLVIDLEARRQSEFINARDIKELIVLPDTEEHACAFVELPSVKRSFDHATRTPYVRLANYVVAFSWDRDWEELVLTLQRHTNTVLGEGLPVPYYFIDVLAHDQHATAMHKWECRKGLTTCSTCQSVSAVNDFSELTTLAKLNTKMSRKDWLQAPDLLARQLEDSRRATSYAKHTLMLLSPWHEPRPLRRAWPLYQAWCTMCTPGCELELLMPDEQADEMQAHFIHTFRAIVTKTESIDVRLAEADFDEDQERILGAIELSPDSVAVTSSGAASQRDESDRGRSKQPKLRLGELNKRLKVRQKRWLVQTARELLDEEHAMDLWALGGPLVRFCRPYDRSKTRQNYAGTTRSRVLCCLPPGAVVQCCGDSLLGVAATLLWVAAVDCAHFVLKQPSETEHQLGISDNGTGHGDDDWRRSLSVQAAMGGVACVLVGSLLIRAAGHTAYLAKPDGIRQEWTRSAMVLVPLHRVSRCAEVCGCGRPALLRHGPRTAGVLVCTVAAVIGCSIHFGLHGTGHASGRNPTTVDIDTAPQRYIEVLLMYWLWLLLGVLTERFVAASRAVEYDRAELAALMGSVQLELREKQAAADTFRAARERLVRAFGKFGPAGAWRTDCISRWKVTVSPRELTDRHWGQLWASGWPAWSEEDASVCAKQRANSLLTPRNRDGQLCEALRNVAVTVLSGGMAPWRRRLVTRSTTALFAERCAALAPLAAYCATALAVVVCRFGESTWQSWS